MKLLPVLEEKITKLINACTEDRELAKEFLLGSKKEVKEVYPIYRVRVEFSKISLERKLKYGDSWMCVDNDYYRGTPEESEESIKRLQRKIEGRRKEDIQQKEQQEFKEYTINF